MRYEEHQSVPALLGLTEAEARAWAEEHDLLVRVLPGDGGVLTLEMNLRRVNLVLEDERVVKASIF